MEQSILVVEDDEILGENIRTYLSLKGYEVTLCDNAELALEQIKRAQPDAVLTDNSLPGMSGHDLLRTLIAQAPELKVIMMTGYGNVEDAVQAMKEGAFHYLTKPVVLAELKLTLDKALAADRMERTLSFYQEREAQKSGLGALIGESPVMHTLKHTLRQVLDAERRMASDDLPPVLVEGETGTGKELVARALHFDGSRSKGPFIEFNCASIPANLLEAELFGHEKGAFTDAKERRVGLVEAADGGTLFLDEIGEMDLVLQAKLLKLLEDRSIRRIGAVKERKVDLRVISATNCNLEQMVQQGKFRRDLFFRLRIIALKVPRLHARGQDVLLLARHFLAHHGRRYGKPNLRFSAEAESLMLGYSWPGNVRELRNMLEQTVLLAPTEVVHAHQLNLCMTLIDEPLTPPTPMLYEVPRHEPEPGTSLPDMERDLVCKTLDRTDWNVTKSARMLGLSRDMLRYRIEKLGLTRPDKRQW